MATRQIFPGLLAWTPRTYALGERISNATRAYQIITAGTSTVAPTGTAADSAPGGTAHWKHLSLVDFTSIQTWHNSLPSTLTAPEVGEVWDCGPITTVSTPFVTFSGKVTTPTNSITLKAAAGEGIRDIVGTGGALAFHPERGVRFVCPGSATGFSQGFVQVLEANVYILGLQFQDPLSTSGSAIVLADTPSDGFVMAHCVLDGYTQPDAQILVLNSTTGPSWIINCVIIDRQAGSFDPTMMAWWSDAVFLNTLVVSIPGDSAVGGLHVEEFTGVLVENCAFFGYTDTITTGGAGSLTVTTSIFSAAIGTGSGNAIDGGGIQSGVVDTDEYIAAGTDYRLKLGASAIGTGTVDPTNNPGADDLKGTARGGAWDIGPVEYQATGIVQNAGSTMFLGLGGVAGRVIQRMLATDVFDYIPTTDPLSASALLGGRGGVAPVSTQWWHGSMTRAGAGGLVATARQRMRASKTLTGAGGFTATPSEVNLEFDDNFSTLSLYDTRNPGAGGTWKPTSWYSPADDGNAVNNAFMVNPFNPATPITDMYQVSGGSLLLRIKNTPPAYSAACASLPYVCSQVMTSDSFLRQGGYWEARIAVPALPGNNFTFWLYADGQSTEIDIAEIVTQADGFQFCKFSLWNSTEPRTIVGEFYTYDMALPIDCSVFNVYGFEWVGSVMRLYIERVLMATFSTPAGYTNPMFIMLSNQEGDVGWLGGLSGTVNHQAQIDYVRYWNTRPFA